MSDEDLGAIWDYLQTLPPRELILLERGLIQETPSPYRSLHPHPQVPPDSPYPPLTRALSANSSH